MANGVAADVAFIRRAVELCSLFPPAQQLSVSMAQWHPSNSLRNAKAED